MADINELLFRALAANRNPNGGVVAGPPPANAGAYGPVVGPQMPPVMGNPGGVVGQPPAVNPLIPQIIEFISKNPDILNQIIPNYAGNMQRIAMPGFQKGQGGPLPPQPQAGNRPPNGGMPEGGGVAQGKPRNSRKPRPWYVEDDTKLPDDVVVSDTASRPMPRRKKPTKGEEK